MISTHTLIRLAIASTIKKEDTKNNNASLPALITAANAVANLSSGKSINKKADFLSFSLHSLITRSNTLFFVALPPSYYQLIELRVAA